jgi:SAM-dependent methyltransferase
MKAERINKKAWDRIFRDERNVLRKEPQEGMSEVVRLFEKKDVKRVLDLGCGTGRHLVYLAKRHFDVYGIDIAEHGMKLSKEWLRVEGFRAKLRVGDIYKKLPYRDDFFDAIISVRTLHHGKMEWIRRLVREIVRVLKPGGYIFITVLKHVPLKYIPKERRYGIRYIAPRTYVILGGLEKGLPHYRFNQDLLRRTFKDFKIQKLWVDSINQYCLIGRLRIKSDIHFALEMTKR